MNYKRLFFLMTWLLLNTANAADESDYYKLITITHSKSPTASRSKQWRPGDGIALEASGMTAMKDGRLAVTIRKGEVWLLDGVYDDPPISALLDLAHPPGSRRG